MTNRQTKARTVLYQDRDVEEVILYKHSSSLKPVLDETNKLWRYSYAVGQMEIVTGPFNYWSGHYDRVHIDEKWFWISRDDDNYFMDMTKVMFLCAQARPRINCTTGTWWNGKIGMWPVGHYGAACWESINKPAGTQVWINETMDKNKYREMLVDSVIPAIAAKWPMWEWNNPNFKIRIQQDGARAHCKEDDPFLMQTLAQLEANQVITPSKLSFYTQPENSPDLNICHLGLFDDIQSAYYQDAPKDSIEIIRCVLAAYDQYPINLINRMFVTLMSVFTEIVNCHGDNTYKLPYMNQPMFEKEGELPQRLKIPSETMCIIYNFHNNLQYEDDTFFGIDSEYEGAGGSA